ncbi:hypothetical protein BJ741DRAFT_617981 [Chytriomyces cf. hyalinus JEL632]|nr:hypothetical protein BJ741DRAFT_617981 [Chytriomyces cf. hyalinus JEL632]
MPWKLTAVPLVAATVMGIAGPPGVYEAGSCMTRPKLPCAILCPAEMMDSVILQRGAPFGNANDSVAKERRDAA